MLMNLSFRFVLGLAMLVIILLVAIVASWWNIKSVKSPTERRFAILNCVYVWILMVTGIVLSILLPIPWAYLPIVALLLAFPVFIYRASYRRQLIRESERIKSNHAHREETDSK